jgi:hypothetical protein
MQPTVVENRINGLFCLALQLSLIAFTVWFLPTRLTTKRVGILIFLLAVPLLWLVYSCLQLELDGLMGEDVPGIAYLGLGFVCGMVGFAVYVRRRSREQRA